MENGLAVGLREAERAKANVARYVRILVLASAVLLAAAVIGYCAWTPGLDATDGRHDRGRNGIWLQHGWLGSDEWFRRERKRDRIADFRDPANIRRLAGLLREQHITDVFAHVSPADIDGDLPGVDHAQVERFLDAFAGFRVMPWTGGCRRRRVASATRSGGAASCSPSSAC